MTTSFVDAWRFAITFARVPTHNRLEDRHMNDADVALLFADLTRIAARLAEIDVRSFGRPGPLPSSQPTPNGKGEGGLTRALRANSHLARP